MLDQHLAVVAVGGYGRRELAPFSDVDLLFLASRDVPPVVAEFVKRMVRAIWDVGLALGQSFGSVSETLRLAQADPTPATALLQTRLLSGSESLYAELTSELDRRLAKSWGAKLFEATVASVREAQEKNGGAVYLLEPDIKESVGALRDIHLVRWLARIRYGQADPSDLERSEVLGSGDATALEDALEFFTRVRHELQFHFNSKTDLLSREEQLRIAKAWGYIDTESLLGVEQFMGTYFRHSTTVVDIRERFLERSRNRSLLQNARDSLLGRSVGDHLWLTKDRLVIGELARPVIFQDLEKLLDAAELAALFNVEFNRGAIESMRRYFRRPETEGRSSSLAPPLEPNAARKFLRFLSRPGSLARVLRTLHQVGALERLIPEFEHARHLLQFSSYHRYTVDEHTFVMLGHAEALADDDGLLGQAYRKIQRKDLLHLAILLHDLGKGLPEDHSEIGRRIAEATATRFHLNDEDRHTLVLLVHRHLNMANMAFRRNTRDPKIWSELNRLVGDSQTLHMLFVLTAVDVMATTPGNFTSWKEDLLAEVYCNSLRLLDEASACQARFLSAAPLREQMLETLGNTEASRRFLNEVSAEYFRETPVDEIARHLDRQETLKPTDVETFARYDPVTTLTTYTILTTEKITQGLFSKICGSLAAHGLDVLRARIMTLSDNTVVDQFDCLDPRRFDPLSDDREKKVGTTVRRVLTDELSVADILWSTRSSIFAPKPRVVAGESTRVVVDNDSSDEFTVIDVITINRRGLLYTLAKCIHRLGLSVHFAKIATYEDEVVDVFYVQEFDGRKVHRDDRIELIRAHLLRDVRTLATDPRTMGF